jgi:ElaB/YqjD/DUF883 family membrane-anchored ribosome-binding protein
MVTRAHRLALKFNPYLVFQKYRSVPAWIETDTLPSNDMGIPHSFAYFSASFIQIMAIFYSICCYIYHGHDPLLDVIKYFIGNTFASVLFVNLGHTFVVELDQYFATSCVNHCFVNSYQEQKSTVTERGLQIIRDTTSRVQNASSGAMKKAAVYTNSVKSQIVEKSEPVVSKIKDTKEDVSKYVKENPVTSAVVAATALGATAYVAHKMSKSYVSQPLITEEEPCEEDEEYSVDSLIDAPLQHVPKMDIPSSVSTVSSVSTLSQASRRSRRREKMKSQSYVPLTYEELRSFMKVCERHRQTHGALRNRRLKVFYSLQALCTQRNPDDKSDFDYSVYLEKRNITEVESNIRALIAKLEKEMAGRKASQLHGEYGIERDDRLFCPESHVGLFEQFLQSRNIRARIVPISRRDWKLVAQRDRPRILSNGFVGYALDRSQPLKVPRKEIDAFDQGFADRNNIPIHIVREFLNKYNLDSVSEFGQYPHVMLCRYVEIVTGQAKYPLESISNEWVFSEQVHKYRGIPLDELNLEDDALEIERVVAFNGYCDRMLSRT